MSVWMVGIDHSKASLDMRSGFSFTRKKMEEAYSSFRTCAGLSGNVILSTCNRTEWWLSVTETATFSPGEALCAYLGLDAAAYVDTLIERRGGAAAMTGWFSPAQAGYGFSGKRCSPKATCARSPAFAWQRWGKGRGRRCGSAASKRIFSLRAMTGKPWAGNWRRSVRRGRGF